MLARTGGRVASGVAGYPVRMLWIIFVVLGIVAFALIILGKR